MGTRLMGGDPLFGGCPVLSGHLCDSVLTDPKGSLALQVEVATRKMHLCLDAGPVGRTARRKWKAEGA